MNKRGDTSSLEAGIGLVVGIIITLILIAIGSIIYRLLIKTGPDEGTLRTFEELTKEIEQLSDGMSSEVLASISRNYAIVGFRRDSNVVVGDTCYKSEQRTLFGGKSLYPTSYFINITKPCAGNCLCLIDADFFEKKTQQLIILNKKTRKCYDLEKYDILGIKECGNGAVLINGDLFGEKNIFPVSIERNASNIIIIPRKYKTQTSNVSVET